MERFAGRRVLVTGGGSGIGQATVLRLLREGAQVAAADVSEDGLAMTVERAAQGGLPPQLTVHRLDISDEAAVALITAEAIDVLGGLDVLVNSAGILRSAHTEQCSLDLWNQIISVNLTGTFLITRAALPALLATGHGVVVNFSSTSAQFAHPYMAAYAASKGGIQAFTHVLALEYAKQGLRAVAVAPGGIASGITENTAAGLPSDTDFSLFAKTQPLLARGFVDPEVVAGVVAMLASDDGRWITGTEIRIDGGTHA
jgi:NAD(P)-dependent dehydrogenase (short-subunit alcohol dehydrogenase family)